MTYIPREDATDSERIALIESAVCDMRDRLFGNEADPGELGRLRRGMRAHRKSIHSLLAWRWMERGVFCAVMLWMKFGGHAKGLVS